MKREEAIDVLKNPNEIYQDSDGFVGYTFNPNRKNFEAFQLAIKALKQEKQELKQESVLDKIRAEIDTQDKWLAQAGYTAYNVDIAFNSIKRVLAESEV